MIYEGSIAINRDVYEEFEDACNNSDYEAIEHYLHLFPELTTYNDAYFFTLILKIGDVELVKLFVKYGADIKKDFNTIMYICACYKHHEITDYLLDLKF